MIYNLSEVRNVDSPVSFLFAHAVELKHQHSFPNITSIRYNSASSKPAHLVATALSLTQKIIRKAAGMQSLAGLKAKVRAMLYDGSAMHRIEAKIAPIELDVDINAPVRINLLIPEINFRTFFGGYIAKFILAQKLMDAGHKVRFVLVDPCQIDQPGWREMVAQYAGIENIFDRVEVVACEDRSRALSVSPRDKLIATTWWTAHIAHGMAQTLGIQKFFYLIQEYEPFTFAMGAYYAVADESYTFPHTALFSSPQLRDYFQQNQIGIFGQPWGDASQCAPFENAILQFDEADAFQGRVPGEYKLLFYARPEPHAARNMFEIAYLALVRAIEAGHFDGAKWEFHGIGSQHDDIELPGGHTLKMLGKFGLSEYKQRLLEYDLGLSLMYTPHPSLLPLEMAAAGMWVVSNECLNKTQAELSGISTNLLAAKPTIAGVSEQLARAAAHCDDIEARRAGANVHWASSWDTAFDAQKMAQILQWLDLQGKR